MPDINLTVQEVQTLLRCLNDRIEPPEELAASAEGPDTLEGEKPSFY